MRIPAPSMSPPDPSGFCSAETRPHIAVVEEGGEACDALHAHLLQQGFRVTSTSGTRALAHLMAVDPPDLVLLGPHLPGDGGAAAPHRLDLRYGRATAVVAAIANAPLAICGPARSADGHATTPFDLQELTVCLHEELRRVQMRQLRAGAEADPAPARNLQLGGWRLDGDFRSVTDAQGAPRDLTSGEFDLLWVLATNPGRVLSREVLLDRTRGRTAIVNDRTIDVQISRLRRKLAGPGNPKIMAVRNIGYKLVIAHDSAPPSGIGPAPAPVRAPNR